MRRALLALAAGALAAAACGPRALRPGDVRVAKDGLPYVYVAAAPFDMGCVEGDERCADDEARHRVELSSFWMGQTEVTVAAFRHFMSETKYRTTAESDGWSYVLESRIVQRLGRRWDAPGDAADEGDTRPVVHVSWYDAATYCTWSGGRLPREAEWEFAARGGRPGSIHVWGNEELPVVAGAKQANVWDESVKRQMPDARNIFAGYDDGFARTSPVGAFPPNGFGLHDLAGNVMEWCADWFNKYYYASTKERDPKGPAVGAERILRGGSWNDGPAYLRLSDRFGYAPALHSETIGFRCVRDAAP